jgi:Na+/glutamate symporter
VYLPAHVLYFGVALALLVIMYLCLVKQLSVTGGGKWFYKEVLIAVLYTAGTWGVAFSYSTTYGKVAVYLAFAFGLIALQNLLLFSYYEKEEDLQQGQRSMVLQLGSDTVQALSLVR